MATALVPCASTGEIGDALTRALDLAEQIEALTASIRDGIAADVRLGGHAWRLARLGDHGSVLIGLCALIHADDVMAGLDARPTRLPVAA